MGAFLTAYRDAGGHAFAPVAGFPAILRSRALAALCTLAEAEQRAEAVEDAEWNKFFHLEQLAQSRRAHEWWPCGF
jgi:hypothetical protein